MFETAFYVLLCMGFHCPMLITQELAIQNKSLNSIEKITIIKNDNIFLRAPTPLLKK